MFRSKAWPLGILAVLVFLCGLSLHRSAWAHPHIWVDYRVKAIGGRQGITKLRFTWRFDGMFSKLIMEDKGLKTIGDKETRILRDQAFSNLQNYHYYIYLTLDGEPFEPKQFEDFSARFYQGKQLEYEFTIVLPKPARKIDLTLYDEEFYVDIGPPKERIPETGGTSFMASANFRVKEFVTSAGEDGAPMPVCSYDQGMPRISKMWGNFITYIVTCKAG